MTQHRCPSPRTCPIPRCRRERLACIVKGLLSIVGFGAVIALAGCISCAGGPRNGCPDFPFVYVP